MSARTRRGGVRGLPDPGRGTPTRPETASNCGESPRCPAVTTMDMGYCPCSTGSNPLRYRPDTLDGFIAGTGLTLDGPASP
ncbi:hypothetical protein ACKTSN_25275 [Streptomyces flavusporus]